MKRTILFLACLMGMTFAFAQSSLQDVVYLKNGSIIRGDIIEYTPNDTVKIMTTDGSVFVYDFAQVEKFAKEQPISTINKNAYSVDEKSPWLSGFLSFCIPGLGQFYNGESRKGWVDLATSLGGYLGMYVGASMIVYGVDYEMMYDGTTRDGMFTTGVMLMFAGMSVMIGNGIHSIVDAAKSSNRINAENGYVMYQINDRCAFGMQPSIAYERPQYLQGSKPELSAGMNFKLTF
jgi:TM2 domain-containing membrane protein YozV